MKESKVMHKTIGILAHVDAGKTTFSEQLLYHTKTIRSRGRVDHQDTFLDAHAIEKNRGITVFSDQATFTYNNETYTLIDTPGHVDFSPEMERAIQVMDYAIIVISAVEGVEGHTETVWQLLQQYRVPTFFFINKTDREGANIEAVLHDIRHDLTEDIVLWETTDGILREETVEAIAERDEQLLEAYFTEGYDPTLWTGTTKNMVQQQALSLCMAGSALQDEGVKDFLEMLHMFTETNYDRKDSLKAKVYKIRHDQTGQRLTYLKLLQGTLHIRDEITYRKKTEKITGLFEMNGQKQGAIREAEAGMVIAVTGLTEAQVGDTIGYQEEMTFELIPTLTSTVICEEALHPKDLLAHFQQLNAEDPSLQVVWDEASQEIHVHVMGTIQLEVLQQVVEERFQVEVSFGKPTILYKETVDEAVIGYGHFEPLRHYAEAHLKIEPAPRDSGVTFESVCHVNELALSYQNLIEQYVLEKEHHGLLTGSPLTDVHITLLTGRADQEHTAGGDFREATHRAIRQGLEQAENRILEPFYNFKMKVQLDLVGRVLSDIQQAHGQFDAPETIGDQTVITGTVPVATFMEYPTTFASITNGRGALSLQFRGYAACHNEEAVITRISYNKDADAAYTSSSIFCTKGKGYTVPWYEAKEAMHCQ